MTDWNNIVYGNNVSNSLMFKDLTKYLKNDVFSSGATGTLYTPNGTFSITLFASLYAQDGDRVYMTAIATQE